MEGVAEMKRLLKYNDNTIADKLGFGRTTLWRMQKKSGAAKAKKEEWTSDRYIINKRIKKHTPARRGIPQNR